MLRIALDEQGRPGDTALVAAGAEAPLSANVLAPYLNDELPGRELSAA